MRWVVLIAILSILAHVTLSQEEGEAGEGGAGGENTEGGGAGGEGAEGEVAEDGGAEDEVAEDGGAEDEVAEGGGTGEGDDLKDITVTDPHGFIVCDNATVCDTYPFSECKLGAVSGTNAEGEEGVEREMNICKCDSDNGWAINADGDACMYRSAYYELCNPFPGENDAANECVDEHTSCQDDGSGQNIYRCLCSETYFAVMDKNDTKVCAKILTMDMEELCKTCEENVGTCYALNETDPSTIGCHCPPSRSGDNCETVHVFVKCNVEDFTMEVCYKPHEGFSYDTGSRMYSSGYGNDEACKGKPVVAAGEDNPCKDKDGKPIGGAQRLVLSLSQSQRDRCGTVETKPSIHTQMYQTMIVLESGNTVLIKTTCTFDMYVRSGFQQVGNAPINGNDIGEHLPATVQWVVQNVMRQTLPEVSQLRLGDRIRFVMTMESGTYAAILPVFCSASSSPTMPDPKAVTVPLIIDSCPAPNQEVVTNENNFRPVQLTVVESGYIKMFRLSKGTSVFIHCLCKVCLLGSEADCAFPTCNATDDEAGEEKRKRRSAGLRQKRDSIDNDIITDEEEELANREVALTKELVWYSDPDSGLGMSVTAFAILIAVLIVFLVLFVLLGVFIYYRINRNSKISEMNNAQQPQRFAMPRINRTDTRI